MRLKLLPVLVVSLLFLAQGAMAFTAGRPEGEKYRGGWQSNPQIGQPQQGANLGETTKGLFDFITAPFRWVGDQLNRK